MLFTFMARLLRLVVASALRQFEHVDGVLAARAPQRVVLQELEDPRPVLGLNDAVAERPAGRLACRSIGMQPEAIAYRRPCVDECVADGFEPLPPALVCRGVSWRRPDVREQVARHSLISFKFGGGF